MRKENFYANMRTTEKSHEFFVDIIIFFDQEMGVDEYDDRVIPLELLRDKFVTNYVRVNITPSKQTSMRHAGDKKCDKNPYVEKAKVASVSCIHQCMKKVCRGDENGQVCIFDFPKKINEERRRCIDSGKQ